MKITTFNPLIVTKDAKDIIALFEALGFEKRHSLDANTGTQDLTSVRMKDANGFHVDITRSDKIKQDMVTIRMNVDDFDEAAEILKSNGFRESKIVPQQFTPSSKYAFFISPSGFIIDLIKHIKKDN